MLLERLAVKFDLIDDRINLQAKLGDNFTVDFDTPFADEFITGATTSQSGGCEHFIKTLWTCAKGPPARWLLFT